MTMFTITTNYLDYNKSDDMDSADLEALCEMLMRYWPNVTLDIEAVPS